ncbi:sodium:solute symporter family protein [Synechococcus sp. M16CYN]|uniref:sodium:solute symporter family protein n=1 Tax=Synechococcus sp. M16CYN TaxID=3103139 RepID=UPI00324F652C
MAVIDWFLLILYLLLTLLLGLWLARRNREQDDYFLAGRHLNGWLAGASMAATTFSIDTPLYVAGLVGNRGLAGNWEWWSFALAHVAMTVVFASFWRRSGVLTDAAFTELRYGGAAAAKLRGIKAFLLALPVNCIGIGYAFLALRKVMEALDVVNGRTNVLGLSDTVWLLVIVALMVVSYTAVGGLWAVVMTDLIHLMLALLGALTVAVAALHATGGMALMLNQLHALNRPELVSLVPWTWDKDGFVWLDDAGVSVPMFTAYIAVQWWSFRRSDGGGEFVQRMLATHDERQARLAGWIFLVVNYLIRSWLWVVVALAALVLLPEQADFELGYPALAVDLLPPVGLGLVVVSLVAAFMSTVSTSVNWGASYLTHDLYQRFIRPQAGSRELLLVGQSTTLLLLMLGVATALVNDSVGMVFRLVIAIGSGSGIVLVLRWFWWRINAAAELSAMLCGFIVGLFTSVVPLVRIDDYGLRLTVITLISAAVWLTVMLLTPPESEAVLERFVRTVKPPGPGWAHLRRRFNVKPVETFSTILRRFVLACGILFGGLLGTGGFLLYQQMTGWFGLGVLVISFLLLHRPALVTHSPAE